MCNFTKSLRGDFEEHWAVLKNLKNASNLIITRPDKGRGVVLMNKNEYDSKLLNILNDPSKFKRIDIEMSSCILALEDKLNRILRDIKQIITDTVYNRIYASGSKPGILYGLPKIHKIGNPIRPIISSIGTFNYRLAKFLVPILTPLANNQYTVENSTKFVTELKSLHFDHYVYMASFDVESLFTNVPLKETIKLIIDSLYSNDLDTKGLDKKKLGKLLDLATSGSAFLYKDTLYSQIDGVAMGSPLGSVFANAFMCNFETLALDECPNNFKPLYYRRYVDDSFLIFKEYNHIEQFLNYLNSLHPNIKFTCEYETDDKLPFLDTTVIKDNNRFSTDVYRKPTFTGLGLNYLSFSPRLYKINCIKTLINRAYNICSNFTLFHCEMEYLKNFFLNNGYPLDLFESTLKKFLNNKFNPSLILTVPREIRYLKLPYYGYPSIQIRKQLSAILKHAFPQVNFRIVFKNNLTIGNYLKEITKLPTDLYSNVIYQFQCPSCNAGYIGSTTRWLKHRIADHKGVSCRTYRPLSNPSFSSIREHSHQHDHLFTDRNFKVLSKTSDRLDLITLESLFIQKMKPSLNNSATATRLFTH